MGLLGWAVLALVVALIAGALGYTRVARGAKTIAYILFGVFLLAAVVLFVMVIFGIAVIA
ncbi:MAG: DUF1328 domain-containing protein [Scytonema sp. PMC 1069.18]|nr:DUF1328 domain-containing protein [Scytonema sp. PMC 1069.18]MEC4880256.1 DUF1328 domain-containing protein [Scytonema sp. PMC 1070.18]